MEFVGKGSSDLFDKIGIVAVVVFGCKELHKGEKCGDIAVVGVEDFMASVVVGWFMMYNKRYYK